MRHRKSFNHLGRKTAHRKAMLSNMASSLIMNKRIQTTTAKAKALRSYIEPLLTKAKEDTTHSRRVVFSYLQDKDSVSELFREVAQKIGDRPGGYTRILKIGNRLGDNADMAIIELVDYNENIVSEKSTAKSSTRRKRRGSGSTGKQEQESTKTVVAESDELVEDAKIVEEEVKSESTEVETAAVAAVADVAEEKAEEVEEDVEPKAEKVEEEVEEDVEAKAEKVEEKKEEGNEEKKDS